MDSGIFPFCEDMADLIYPFFFNNLSDYLSNTLILLEKNYFKKIFPSTLRLIREDMMFAY